MRNSSLHAAMTAKKDEFYTQYNDIQEEINAYLGFNPHTFRDKTVLCNCDDPYESNFFKFFALNFNFIGLKKLICTCWNGSPIAQKELALFTEKPAADGRSRIAYKAVLTRKAMENNKINGLQDVQTYLKNNPPALLKENGDFRSRECIELLQEADIVVTNPPSSVSTSHNS